MDKNRAIDQLAALAHGARLSLLRALTSAGGEGLSAGEIARMLDLSPSSVSGLLRVLHGAGLIERRKRGKASIYTVGRSAFAELGAFLAQLSEAPPDPASFTLSPVAAGSGEFIGLRATLGKNNLPTDDLGGEGQLYFALMDQSGSLHGYGGIEGEGADRLLRSLVILPGSRGRGMGQAMVKLIEGAAKRQGVRRLWLPTQDAEKYFAWLGYKVVERVKAPKAIERTKQFAKLCPASAKLMVKELKG